MRQEKLDLNFLISADECILIVIDVQDQFLDKLPTEEKSLLTNRIGWLAAVAYRLQVPLLVTLEDVAELGGLVPAVAARLPAGVPQFNKMHFSLVAEPAIMAELAATGRQTVVLVGLETDVCVAQSALGLLQAGYRVVALADACGSPDLGHQAGLDRMKGAGVLISTVKGLYYEWVPTVARHQAFMAQYGHELGRPPGVRL